MSTAKKVEELVNIFEATRLKNTDTPKRRLARFNTHAKGKRKRGVIFVASPDSSAMALDQETGAVRKRGRPRKMNNLAGSSPAKATAASGDKSFPEKTNKTAAATSSPSKIKGKLFRVLSAPKAWETVKVFQGADKWDPPVGEEEEARAAREKTATIKKAKAQKRQKKMVEDNSEDKAEDPEGRIVTLVRSSTNIGRKEAEERSEPPAEEEVDGEEIDNGRNGTPELQSTSKDSYQVDKDPSRRANGQPTEQEIEMRDAIGSEVKDDVEEEEDTAAEKAIYSDVEMFGQGQVWKQVVDGIYQIKIPPAKFEELKYKRLKSAEEIVRFCCRASEIYRELVDDDTHPADVERDLRVRLERATNDIEHWVDEIEKRPQKYEKSNRKDALYQATVYALGIVLIKAHAADTARYSRRDDIKILKSMMNLQKLIISLCEKATLYYAKALDEDETIKHAIRENILKNMKTKILKAFEMELAERKTRRRDAQQKERSQLARLKEEERQIVRDQYIEERKRMVLEDLTRNKPQTGGFFGSHTRFRYPGSQATGDKFTDSAGEGGWTDRRGDEGEDISASRIPTDIPNTDPQPTALRIPSTKHKSPAESWWTKERDNELLTALKNYGHLPGQSCSAHTPLLKLK